MKNAVPNDRLRTLIHTICLGGASTLSLTAVSMPSQAADAAAATGTSEELSEITVTGIRASLQQSLDIKKNSDGIVDAISAEDIGKFPDSNLATAMERIPGVTVSRQRGLADRHRRDFVRRRLDPNHRARIRPAVQ